MNARAYTMDLGFENDKLQSRHRISDRDCTKMNLKISLSFQVVVNFFAHNIALRIFEFFFLQKTKIKELKNYESKF